MSDTDHVWPADEGEMESLLFEMPVGHGNGDRRPQAPTEVMTDITEFGEEAYRDAYPDIDRAIRDGTLDSAATHFHEYGHAEQRLMSSAYLQALRGGAMVGAGRGAGLSVDAVVVSASGMVFVVGWLDDRANPVRSISVIHGLQGANTRCIGRCRRGDVDTLLHALPGLTFGFWFVVQLPKIAVQGASFIVRARLADGGFEQREVEGSLVADAELRETALGHFASLEYYGNREVEAFESLETGAGRILAEFNRSISRGITAAAHVAYFGPQRPKFRASLIVCLFGKIEFFFLQQALFGTGQGIEDYEFIYVSNSPELTEGLQKEARIAERIYGHSVTLVTLPGNAGFSAANNVAAKFARSDRLMFINPDVFPRDRMWPLAHAELVDTLPPEQSALFGVPLFYDDGSLMHGGMYFEVDEGLSVKAGGVTAHGVVRVEHYGKGAPASSAKYTQARPVPAVTGAFISADRAWFEALGGFTDDYAFGHYEDADLCLKSLRQGRPAWLHDLPFWHLEGKGSVRRPPHEGGALVNRWLFTQRWGAIIAASLRGPTPIHPLLVPPAPAPVLPMAPAAATSAPVKAAPSLPRPRRAARAGTSSQLG